MEYVTAKINPTNPDKSVESLNDLAKSGWKVIPGICIQRGVDVMLLLEREVTVEPVAPKTKAGKIAPIVEVTA
jgi:hypothetical protein